VAPGALSDHVLQSPPDVHVPEDSALARLLLLQLYDRNADEEISAGFTKFAAVLGADSDEMGVCYMSEINLGMDGLSRCSERIEAAIPSFQRRLASGRHHGGELYYTIGNAYHMLHNEASANGAKRRSPPATASSLLKTGVAAVAACLTMLIATARHMGSNSVKAGSKMVAIIATDCLDGPDSPARAGRRRPRVRWRCRG
jgi:hypothetical protein